MNMKNYPSQPQQQSMGSKRRLNLDDLAGTGAAHYPATRPIKKEEPAFDEHQHYMAPLINNHNEEEIINFYNGGGGVAGEMIPGEIWGMQMGQEEGSPFAYQQQPLQYGYDPNMMHPQHYYGGGGVGGGNGYMPAPNTYMDPSTTTMLFPMQPMGQVVFVDHNQQPQHQPQRRSASKRAVASQVPRQVKAPMHENSVCSNCGTTETTLWRRSSIGAIECNACNLYFRKNGRIRPLSLKKAGIQKRKRNPRIEDQQPPMAMIQQQQQTIRVLMPVKRDQPHPPQQTTMLMGSNNNKGQEAGVGAEAGAPRYYYRKGRQ